MAIALWSVSFAYGEDDITDWLNSNSEIMEQNSLIKDGIRNLVWGLTGLLAKAANACQGLYDLSFGMIDITTNQDINSFIIKWKPVVIAVTAICLLVLGITLMIEHEKKPKIAQNIMIMALCVTCSLTAFNGMNQLVTSLKGGVFEYTGSNETKQFLAYDAIDTHMIDLVYLNNKYNGLENFSYSSIDTTDLGAGIVSSESFKEVDYSEKLNYNSDRYDYKGKTGEILKSQLYIYYESDGTKRYGKTNVYDGVSLGGNSKDSNHPLNSFYYRYTFDVLPAWIELIAIMMIYLTMSYKCIRVAFELVVARLLAYVYSAELSGGEKIRKILVFIRDSYILLIVCCLCIKVYILLNAYATAKAGNNTLIAALLSLFMAFCVIDGPNLVEKLLGMDAGLKSSTARMMAIGGTAMGVAKSTGKAAGALTPKNVARRVGNAKENIKSGKVSQGGIPAGIYGALNNQEGKEEGKNSKTSKNSPLERSSVENGAVNGTSGGTDKQSDVSAGTPAESNYADNASDVMNEGVSESKDNANGALINGANESPEGRSFGDKEKPLGQKKSKEGSKHSFMNESRSNKESGKTSLPKRTTTARSKYTDLNSNRTESGVKINMETEKRSQQPNTRKIRKDPPLE